MKSKMFSIFKLMLICFFYLSNYFLLHRGRLSRYGKETVFLVVYIEVSEKVVMVLNKDISGA
jgi:hypothetical protein